MAEEIKTTEQITGVVENQNVTDEVKDGDKQKTVESPEEKKQSVLGYISDKIKEYVGSKQGEEANEKDKYEEVTVPDEFYNAAIKANWTDDAIMDFVLKEDGTSKFTNEELIEMIKDLSPTASVKTEPVVEQSKKVEDKVIDSQEDEKIKPLLERIAALENVQKAANEQTEQQKLDNLVHRATQLMDDSSKEIEVLGKAGELPAFPDGRVIMTSPQMKARREVWGVAYALHQTGMGFDEAMKVSLNAYRGKNLTQDVKRNIIKDLKKNEKKLSAKRSTHEPVNTPKSGPEVIREVGRKHGVEIL